VIVERAQLEILAGQEAAFEAAFVRAREIVAAADGVRAVSLGRGVESPSRYLLLVEWESLEAHTVGFRQSEQFTRWRELVGPYFASPPEVEHYEPVVP
jgi:heme-degrading monooxygenase HmoA